MRHILIATTALVLTACGERADTSGSGTTGGAADGSSTAAMGTSNDGGQTGTTTRGEAGMGGQDAAGGGQAGMTQGSGMQGDAVPGGTASGAGTGTGTVGSASQGSSMQGSGMTGAGMTGAGMQGAGMTGNSPQAYVANAAMSDMYERESSKLAVSAGQSAAVKAFARQMITDHTATTAEVKKIVSDGSLGITPPAQLDSRRQGLVDDLKKATGGDFDRMYIQQQVAAHREALAVHRGFSDAGTNAPLKAFAMKTAPKVQMHLEMVEKLGTAGR